MKRRVLMFCCGNPEIEHFPPPVERFIQDAQELSTLGYYRYAAVAGRCSLEMSLGAAADRFGCWPTRTRDECVSRLARPSVEHFIETLSAAGRLVEIQLSRLRYAAHIGNEAAHAGQFTGKPGDVFQMLACSQELITKINKLDPPTSFLPS